MYDNKRMQRKCSAAFAVMNGSAGWATENVSRGDQRKIGRARAVGDKLREERTCAGLQIQISSDGLSRPSESTAAR